MRLFFQPVSENYDHDIHLVFMDVWTGSSTACQDLDYLSHIQTGGCLGIVAWRCRTIYAGHSRYRHYTWTVVSQAHVLFRIDWIPELDPLSIRVIVNRLIQSSLGQSGCLN